jgi:hypothetical protein
MFYIIVILAAIFTMPAFGQSREQLVGAWTLVSCNATAIFCSPNNNPNGILIFDAGGRYALTLAARDRPKFNIPNPPPSVRDVRLQAKPEEYKAAVIGFAANFGSRSFNEANKTLTLHYDGALFPNVEGEEVTATVTSFSGDEVKFSDGNGWRRVQR